VSQRKRKRVEEVFGWMKTIALQRKTRFRGPDRVGWMFTFAAAAYNLVRMRNLLAPPVPERPAGTLPMAITAAAGTPDQPTLDAATSNYRIKTTYSELSRGAFQQPASAVRLSSRKQYIIGFIKLRS